MPDHKLWCCTIFKLSLLICGNSTLFVRLYVHQQYPRKAVNATSHLMLQTIKILNMLPSLITYDIHNFIKAQVNKPEVSLFNLELIQNSGTSLLNIFSFRAPFPHKFPFCHVRGVGEQKKDFPILTRTRWQNQGRFMSGLALRGS